MLLSISKRFEIINIDIRQIDQQPMREKEKLIKMRKCLKKAC